MEKKNIKLNKYLPQEVRRDPEIYSKNDRTIHTVEQREKRRFITLLVCQTKTIYLQQNVAMGRMVHQKSILTMTMLGDDADDSLPRFSIHF